MDSMEPMTSSGLPWLDQPVMLHSSRADTCKLTPQQCEYRHGFWRYWYQADHVYALGTVYFMCAAIGVFALAHGLSTYSPKWVLNNKVGAKMRALVRYLSYSTVKQYRGGLRVLPSASLGVGLLVLVGVVFFAAMTLGPKPYYWPNTQAVSYGSSPPIATRAGWMALGLLPFVLAFAAKANLISALTGVPYEKLQIFHHWASYAMFVLALIHTFPFIVYHIQQGDMVMEWNTSVTYWTGVAALVPQAYLTFMSIPWIRNRYYEFFKSTHITVSILFIVFFFLHCDFRLTSWDYFIAAGAIYLFSVVYAWAKTYLFHGLHTAHISLLPDDSGDEQLIEITIPTTISWKPGQHVFLRFLTMHPHSLTAHPFTIASVPHPTEICGHPNEMKFFVKPHTTSNSNSNSSSNGFTGRLAAAITGKPRVSMRVFLEGPYSGVDNALVLGGFEHVLYIAGGSGAGFSLGVVEDAIRRSRNSSSRNKTNVQVVYATRSGGVARWYKEKIESMTMVTDSGDGSGGCCCRVAASIHVTSDKTSTLQRATLQDATAETTNTEKNILKTTTDTSSPSDSSSSETPSSSPSSAKNIQIHNDNQRPNIKSVIASACQSSTHKKTAVVVCGPASMIHDARQAVADEQARLLKECGGGEVYLHVEAFSW